MTHDEPRRSGKCGYIAPGAAGVLHAALTCLIRAQRACAVLDCWRHGIVWQRSPVRCLLPCIRALREKENFQLFHFIQPLKMVHFMHFSMFRASRFSSPDFPKNGSNSDHLPETLTEDQKKPEAVGVCAMI